MTRLRPRTARTAAAGLVATATLVLAGCSATNPITTIGEYEASDGAGTAVGDVRVLNMLVVTEALDAPGVLTGAVKNNGTAAEEVTLQVGDADPVLLRVPASGTVLVGAADAPARYTTADVPVATVDARPGGLTPLTITTGAGGTVELMIPVLDGTLPEYAALLDGATPSPRSTQDASEPQPEEIVEENQG